MISYFVMMVNFYIFFGFFISSEISCRIRFLCQQKWPSITERIYGALGGHANRLWYVI